MRGHDAYRDKPRAYRTDGTDFDELRRRANANLKKLAEERHKPKPEKPDRKKGPDRLDILLGELVEELDVLMKLERKIARRSEHRRGFEGSDYSQGMWEEVDHRIEQLQERLDPLDTKERSRVKRVYRRYCRKGRRP